MTRKLYLGALLIGLTLASNGCVALLAGAGGGVLWQAGKAISEENVSMDRGAAAVHSVFRANQIKLKEEVSKTRSTQIRGERLDGAKVAVDVISLGPRNVRFEVRVGIGEKSGAREILSQIKKAL